MSDGGNPVGAFISLWMFLKLVGVLASLGGGIYALFCLSRIASGAHRIADALETSLAQQSAAQLNLQRDSTTMQPFSPTVAAPVSVAPIAAVPGAPTDTSSTRSPEMTEHDVRPRSDSF